MLAVGAAVLLALVAAAIYYFAFHSKKKREQEGQKQATLAKVMVINFAPDTATDPEDYATLLQTYKARGTADLTIEHCGDTCSYTASTGFGFMKIEGMRGWRYRREGPACASLSFDTASLAHVNTGNEFKIDTPYGKGKYRITLGVGDCAFLVDSVPRLSLKQGSETMELIGDADHAAVDGKMAVVTKEVEINSDAFSIFDPRTPNDNAAKGTATETVPMPYTVVFVYKKEDPQARTQARNYNISKSEVPTVLSTIRSVYPTAELAAKEDITNLANADIAHCACGWVTKSRTDTALSTYYPSKEGTSGGCGGGQKAAIGCGDDGPSWSDPAGLAGMYVKINPHPAVFAAIPAALDAKTLVAQVIGASQPSAMQPTRLQYISLRRVS